MAKKKAEPAAAKAKPAPKSKPAKSAKGAKSAKSDEPVSAGGAEGVGIATPPGAKPSAPPAKATAVKKSGAKSSASKAGPAAKREFSTEEIGHVAGDVWRMLSTEGTLTAAELTKAVAAPAELVAAALGWLAREDKLAFATNGRSVSVSLV